jgi:hypothetical protein
VIEEFRAGRLQFLCNYGVLTTGFDAPKIRAVIIARPTTSVVLYEQMIGRGMRGPLNGGTEECQVIDLQDNIARFQGQMAFTSACVRCGGVVQLCNLIYLDIFLCHCSTRAIASKSLWFSWLYTANLFL